MFDNNNMSTVLEILESVWQNDDDDLPFHPQSAESRLAAVLSSMHPSDEDRRLIQCKMKQWLKFRAWINDGAEEDNTSLQFLRSFANSDGPTSRA